MNTYYCVCVFNTGSTVYIDFDFTGDKKEHARTEKIQIHTHTQLFIGFGNVWSVSISKVVVVVVCFRNERARLSFIINDTATFRYDKNKIKWRERKSKRVLALCCSAVSVSTKTVCCICFVKILECFMN